MLSSVSSALAPKLCKMSSLKFCANLNFMFTESPNLLERYNLAKKAGFQAVEVGFPYIHTVEELVKAKEDAGLKQVLINVFVGDPSKGELGFAAIPGQEASFQSSVTRAVDYAKALDCKLIHVMSGAVQNPTSSHHEAYEKNIRWATKVFEREEIIGLIEPINQRSVPNYYMSSYVAAVDLIKKINSPNLKIMLDVFHLQQLHGNLTSNIESLAAAGLIGHVQVAQVPLRGEPNTGGEIDYSYVFSLLKKINYTGWIGLEYKPSVTTVEGLKWVNEMGFKL
ncbi:putative hydroxypyruvate isomerase [Thrips palmi]|uniref:Putative hydroxypyruvate isomerase n=1 Tax=Thrips palmi TaxID=161013 RepID=A0A6P8YDI6_THRPL|nr:putative hydroxypyruvate isomerase [Thrips palmi]